METPALSPAYAPGLVPGGPFLLAEPHVRLIALLANNFDVKWVMSQVGHADSEMTMDVYAQLEQRAATWQHLGNSRIVRCVQGGRGSPQNGGCERR